MFFTYFGWIRRRIVLFLMTWYRWAARNLIILSEYEDSYFLMDFHFPSPPFDVLQWDEVDYKTGGCV